MTTFPDFTYGQPRKAPLPLEDVYEGLVQVVSELRRDGRSTRSAGIKPRLGQRLGVPLDEKAYGFTNFREFLRAAEKAGVIELWPASSGPDTDVVLPGERPQDSQHRESAAQIRPDFWATFMDWTPGYERAYDRDAGHAFRLLVAAEAYDAQVRVQRQAMQAEARRFVPIEPIDLATQTGWARDFTTERPSGHDRDALTQALRAERPLQEFTRWVRTLSCQQDWITFRNERVAEVIRQWARRHEVTVDPLQPMPDRPRTAPTESTSVPLVRPESYGVGSSLLAQQPKVSGRISQDINVAALRAQAHDLIDRMSAEELLTLPLTLGMLYRR